MIIVSKRELFLKFFVIKMNQKLDLTKLLLELDKQRGKDIILGEDLANCVLIAMIEEEVD